MRPPTAPTARERRARPSRWSSVGTRTVRRTVVSAGVLVMTLAATACGPSVPTDPPGEPAGPPTAATTPGTPSTPSSTPRSSTDPEAALRTRLADALRSEDPVSAGVVADATTQLAVVDAPWLPDWQVVDVQVRRMPHPQRFSVGLSAAGQARYLTGKPANFSAMVQAARIRVTSETAVALTRTFLDATRTFTRWSYRVDSVGDIEWRPGLTAAEQQQRDAVEKTYAHRVSALRATPAGDGWTLTAWMVDGNTLVRHDLSITADGATTDVPTVVARDLPVPDSV